VERIEILERQRVLALDARPWQNRRRLHLHDDLLRLLEQS
jgi:hypothetical protein